MFGSTNPFGIEKTVSWAMAARVGSSLAGSRVDLGRHLGTTAEVERTCPALPSACTAKSASPLVTGTAVSKPVDGTCVTVPRLAGSAPAITRQGDTSVAPFQLA